MEMPSRITILLFVLAFSGDTVADDDDSGLCKLTTCGKGTCNRTGVSLGLFSVPSCECNIGWKKPLSFPFAPCVIPNCTLDASCSQKSPSSASSPLNLPTNSSDSTGIIHPCAFSVCGGSGSCKTTSQYGYSCVCEEGYENLLNMTSAPCVRECSIGADCARLGINVAGSRTSPPPSQAVKSDGNKGSSTPSPISTSGCGSENPCRTAMAVFSLCVLLVFRNPLL